MQTSSAFLTIDISVGAINLLFQSNKAKYMGFVRIEKTLKQNQLYEEQKTKNSVHPSTNEWKVAHSHGRNYAARKLTCAPR
jgi:hypothetical protein